MNKGLGKLILIAGLGLGALYFLRSDNKKVSNSEVKKETKEHPSLDKEIIETIVEDHKEEKKEEPKKEIDNEKKPLAKSKMRNYYAKKHYNKSFNDLSMSEAGYVNDVLRQKGYRLNNLKQKEINEEIKLMRLKALRKGQETIKRNKLSKAEAGKLGGEATAELGKHKGHKSTKGLSQDQKLVSKEEHEKHYQLSKIKGV